MKQSKLGTFVAGAVVALFISYSAQATTILLGITGDGASTSETLFTIDTGDASSAFFLGLGNGEDGETIAFNPDDGLLYHASGIDDGDRFWESINVNTKTIVTSQQFTGPNVDDEQTAMTYQSSTGTFLVVDRDEEFFSVSLGGAATDIGGVGTDIKGLAFVGSTLFGAAIFEDNLFTLDPADGSTLTTLTVTLDGNAITGLNGLATNPDTGELFAIVRVTGNDSTPSQPSGRFLATIDTATGAATSIGTLSDNFAGIAFVEITATVPEPGTLALFGLGLLGLGVVRRRRMVS